MKNIFMNAKELNVKIGDKVAVQGNRGIVTEVFKTEDRTDVRVHFTDALASWGQYQDGVYGMYEVISKQHEEIANINIWLAE